MTPTIQINENETITVKFENGVELLALIQTGDGEIVFADQSAADVLLKFIGESAKNQMLDTVRASFTELERTKEERKKAAYEKREKEAYEVYTAKVSKIAEILVAEVLDIKVLPQEFRYFRSYSHDFNVEFENSSLKLTISKDNTFKIYNRTTYENSRSRPANVESLARSISKIKREYDAQIERKNNLLNNETALFDALKTRINPNIVQIEIYHAPQGGRFSTRNNGYTEKAYQLNFGKHQLKFNARVADCDIFTTIKESTSVKLPNLPAFINSTKLIFKNGMNEQETIEAFKFYESLAQG